MQFEEELCLQFLVTAWGRQQEQKTRNLILCPDFLASWFVS